MSVPSCPAYPHARRELLQAYHINVVHEDGFERRYEVSDMSAATPDQLGKDPILGLREEDVLYNRSDPEKLTGDALQQVRPSLCHCPSKTGPVCSACCASQFEAPPYSVNFHVEYSRFSYGTHTKKGIPFDI